jgi:rRNA small subunit methyltransferase G
LTEQAAPLLPPIEQPLRQPLLEVAASLQLNLTALQSDTLLAYLAMLQRWNATYNLTSIRDAQGMLIQHVADCLAVINPLKQHFLKTPSLTQRFARRGDCGDVPEHHRRLRRHRRQESSLHPPSRRRAEAAQLAG